MIACGVTDVSAPQIAEILVETHSPTTHVCKNIQTSQCLKPPPGALCPKSPEQEMEWISQLPFPQGEASLQALE